jgi:antitoxin (DNA-binding transcriptional repressor) of toxin-antitoxin stability system
LGKGQLHYSYICGAIYLEVAKIKFVGVREFKQDAVKYLNEGSEIVVMKRKKPIARVVPVLERTGEMVLLEIRRVLNEAGISQKEALSALARARQEIYLTRTKGEGRGILDTWKDMKRS